MLIINDPHLSDLFINADPEDLSVLADFVTDKGNGRISLSSSACENLNISSKEKKFSIETKALLAEEIHRFGGNTLANFFRGGAGVPYKEIVRDVASHLRVPYDKEDGCAKIEMIILEKLLEQTISNMDPDQIAELLKSMGATSTGFGSATAASVLAALRLTGLSAYEISALVANAVAKTILGRSMTIGASSTLARGVSALTGPIGWALTAIWAAYDFASPAYRVTVPSVVQIAYMRQKRALATS